MAEYVKSLVTEHDVKMGKNYKVSHYEDDLVYVFDDVDERYPLYSHEYEKVPNPKTSDTNPFIKTVTERKFVPGYFETENGAQIYMALSGNNIQMQAEEDTIFTKNDIIKLAKYLNEIAEVME